ncbi:MAG: AAA family ATPase [Symploca sp. SIO3C6]|nr:AAA family ATPase [Symploca sp. SIO3C6]
MSFDPKLCRNESEVESKLIVQYLLPKLGYSPDTWYQQVSFESIRLDFLAFAKPLVPFVWEGNLPLSILIEAKHPSKNLDIHVHRLRHYLKTLNVRYGLLTNGKEIRIYENLEYDLQQVFQCSGKEVNARLSEIKALIGRDSLQKQETEIYSEISPLQNNSIRSQDISNHSCAEKRQNSMKTIAIYHHKGGVGKTTVSVNLAAALSKRGKRVLLVDIDAQANTTFATGLIKFQFDKDDNLKKRNVYNLLESTKHEHNFIPGIVKKSHLFNQPEIDVIPSHISLIARQQELITSSASRWRLSKKLDQVTSDYDIVIIDTPPSLDLYAQAALTAADYLIIPSDLKPFSNQGLVSVKNFIEQEITETKEGVGKPDIIILGVLPSKISTNAKYLKHTYAKHKAVITEHYDLPLMDSMISERTALSKCIDKTLPMGNLDIPDPKSILDYAKTIPEANVSAAEFEALAMEVLDKMEMQ